MTAGGGAAPPGAPGADVVRRLGEQLCNWSRWGPDDERGTVNYITPQHVVSAARLVRSGRIFSLAVPFDHDGPQRAARHRFNPLHFVTDAHLRAGPGGTSIADDVVLLPLQCGTQWDALAHVAFDGTLYGGRPASRVDTTGAGAVSIRPICDRIVTRGVLADVARANGVDALEPGHAIGVEELEACLAQQHVDVREGDILLVRTGFLAASRREGWKTFSGPENAAPGLTVWTLEWIHEKRLAGVASDTSAVEIKPPSVPGVLAPFHAVALVYMGLLLGEIFDLDELARDCAADGRYDFLLVAPPLPVTGGMGSPINPYAVK